MTVAAIVPTIPGREDLLAEAVGSVHAQTVPVDEIHCGLDATGAGPAAMRNRLAREAATEWLAFLDDDDIWYPHHIETLLRYDGDVIYSDCNLSGSHPSLVCNVDFNLAALRRGNYIPVTVLLRRSVFEAVGGFDPTARFEDWDLWLRLAASGARFTHVPLVTWCYRFGVAEKQRTFA